ncbi:type VII secretion protein EccE [Mycobacterium kansasii]|uniref:Type VII secretion protein EccE n=4 Tax=Mycobacterium kansasii TaxID=1768 RepID=A0A1V3XL98_MYCKA|nr:type VII secretion protein EccE [Mycobacterium kansasii]EUA01037.1 type VII secretion protein EccE [Mycobacterium kansasii 824]AGZ50058.1 secretion protein EccE [Mycobacterium kansasii ATCC 12478]ARG58068.1 type VII secretion protein EccE [Mycobacterium kansasii]ARG63582.1 type VII secretion protein EccE [Mycobacterium kansasii]ARG71227.1 type VII secretion protein EccE [Mycobacterium kansasii]
MSPSGRRPIIVWPDTWRVTLAVSVGIAAALAYPWRSTHDRWVLAVAVLSVVVLLSYWRGVHLTTNARRRMAITRGRRPGIHRRRGSLFSASIDETATALIRVEPRAGRRDALPLPLIASYLDRYGIRTDNIRIINNEKITGIGQTWIALTVSAIANLAALQARAAHIPLDQTTHVVARRLADHLHELGWTTRVARPGDLPQFGAGTGRETWRAVVRNDGVDYLAAYRIDITDELPDVFTQIRSHPVAESWVVLEIARAATGFSLGAACVFRTAAMPRRRAPLAGMTPQHGNHRQALMALDPFAAQRLEGHTAVPDELLGRLLWPVLARGARAVRLSEAGRVIGGIGTAASEASGLPERPRAVRNA